MDRFRANVSESLIDSGLVGRGAARAENAEGTPTKSQISPSILVSAKTKIIIFQMDYFHAKTLFDVVVRSV